MKKSIFKIGLLSLLVVFVLSGCSFSFPWEKDRSTVEQEQATEQVEAVVQEIKSSGDLRKFANEDALKNFLANSTSAGGLSAKWLLAENDYGQADSGVAEIVASAGVSGADIIKFSGGYIYAIVKNEIFIINALSAAEAKVESRITLSSRPLELLVAGSRLAVFGSDQEIKSSSLVQSFASRNDYTFFKVFDVSDATEPREVRSLSFEGGYVGVRLIGNYAYFLTAQPAAYRHDEPIMPRIIEGNKLISSPCSLGKSCASTDVYYFDAPYRNHTFLSVSAINLASRDEAINNQIYLIDPNYNLHLSASGNFYLARYQALSAYDLEQSIKLDLVLAKLSEGDRAAVAQITSSPESLLNAVEKRLKTAVIVEKYILSLSAEEKEALKEEVAKALVGQVKKQSKDLEKTVIYKFALKAGKIDYRARGEVYGRPMGASAWSEKSDNLRLATARNELWSLMFDDPSQRYSNIYVLDSSLRTLGSLENIVSDNIISAVNFFGDRVYMSAAGDGAPTYVIGLTELSKPAVLGAVRLSGRSRIYQIDAAGEKILGFGREMASSTAGTQEEGIKLSIFDFSDLKKPAEVSSYILGDKNSDSVAFKDYKALSGADTADVVIPVSLRENGELVFSGVLAFALSAAGDLKMSGKIDHSKAGNFNQLDYWRNVQYYNHSVKRSFVVGENLISFSNKYLKINRLSDLSEIISLTLIPDEEPLGVATIFSNDPPPVATPTEAQSEAINENEPASESQSEPVTEETAPSAEEATLPADDFSPAEEASIEAGAQGESSVN